MCAISFCRHRIAWSRITIITGGGRGERAGGYMLNSVNDAVLCNLDSIDLFYLIPSSTPVGRVSLSSFELVGCFEWEWSFLRSILSIQSVLMSF